MRLVTLSIAPMVLWQPVLLLRVGPVRGLLSGPADDTQKVFRLESSPLLLLDALVS